VSLNPLISAQPNNTVKGVEYMADKQSASIVINVDVSEALTGLKALTREARNATAALAELRDAVKEPENPTGVNDLWQKIDKLAIAYGRIGTMAGDDRE
jgi:hypothetical protein